jgi:hypothetical protein
MITVLFLLYPLNTTYATQDKEPEMKLEELVQQLDAANPWPVEAVEKVLGTTLAVTYSSEYILSYESGQLVYDEGLILDEMELRLDKKTREMSRLILSLSDDASCFTLARIKETYPDIQPGPFGLSGVGTLNETEYFWTERQWGHIAFGFKRQRANCLSGITFIPKKWE